MTSFDMNRLLRGEYHEPVATESEGQEQETPASIARQVAGKADGGAGRHDSAPLVDPDFLREAYREHRG